MSEDILKLSKDLKRGCDLLGICKESNLCPSCKKAKEVLLKAIEDELKFLDKLDLEQMDEIVFFEGNEECYLDKLFLERIELLNKCKEMLK